MNNALTILRGTAGIIVSSGVGSIVGNAIKATTPTNLKLVHKITIGAGSVVLSGLAGAMANDYAEAKIDEAAASAKLIATSIKSVRKK